MPKKKQPIITHLEFARKVTKGEQSYDKVKKIIQSDSKHKEEK